MKRPAVGLGVFVWAGFVVPLPTGWTQPPPSPLEKYRQLEFPPKEENFDKGWKNRVALEYEIITGADLKSLRSALKDKDSFVIRLIRASFGRPVGGLPGESI